MAITTLGAIALGLGAAAKGAGAAIQASAIGDAEDKQYALGQQQLAEARNQREWERYDRSEAVRISGELSQKSYGEMAAIERMIRTKEEGLRTSMANLDKELKILDATDPVIKEAGMQLAQLMKGEQAKILDPVMAETQRNRAKLEQKLAAAMGPGWRTSSAGIEAMSKFDAQSTATILDAQFKGINQLTGVFSNVAAARPKNIGLQTSEIFKSAGQIDAAVGQMEQGVQNRITSSFINAWNGTPQNYGAITNALGDQMKEAGKADEARGKVFGDLIGGIGDIGGYIAGKSMTFGDVQSKPSITPNDPNQANFR